MRKTYDFAHSRRNPYAKYFKRQITIRLDKDTIGYFKAMAKETGIKYQNLIDLYLRDCAQEERKPAIKWLKAA